MLPLFDQPVTAQRDAAMAQVLAHAEQQRPTFSEEAQACILAYLEQHGPTSGEVLTLACKRAGIVPPDDRAFGPVLMRLARGGQIVKCGCVPRQRGHGTSGGVVWGLG